MPPSIRIVLASGNPVKIDATRGGFRRMFRGAEVVVRPVSVSSGVHEQPRSDGEALAGASQRAAAAEQAAPDADFWVGIEGGVEDGDGEMSAFAWVVVRTEAQCGRARTGTFFLPDDIAVLVRQGEELGRADDIVFGRTDSKREEGAVGILTGNAIVRAKLYEEAVVLALIPFTNARLYRAGNRANARAGEQPWARVEH